MTFPKAFDPANRNCRLTPPSPLPCNVGQGNGVTIVHHEKVRVDGHASASPFAAAAATPPAGALAYTLHENEIVSQQYRRARPIVVERPSNTFPSGHIGVTIGPGTIRPCTSIDAPIISNVCRRSSGAKTASNNSNCHSYWIARTL
jgi:hypothetical protein